MPMERLSDSGVFLRRRVSEMATPYTVWTAANIVMVGALVPPAVLAIILVDG